MDGKPQAWLVVAADGYRSVFLDRSTAERYAVRVHGLLYALFFGRRRTDDRLDNGSKGAA